MEANPHAPELAKVQFPQLEMARMAAAMTMTNPKRTDEDTRTVRKARSSAYLMLGGMMPMSVRATLLSIYYGYGNHEVNEDEVVEILESFRFNESEFAMDITDEVYSFAKNPTMETYPAYWHPEVDWSQYEKPTTWPEACRLSKVNQRGNASSIYSMIYKDLCEMYRRELQDKSSKRSLV